MLNTTSRFEVVNQYNAGLKSLRQTIETRLVIEGASMGIGCIKPLGWSGTSDLPQQLRMRVVAHNSGALTASFTPEEVLSCAGTHALYSVGAKIDGLIGQFRSYRDTNNTLRRA